MFDLWIGSPHWSGIQPEAMGVTKILLGNIYEASLLLETMVVGTYSALDFTLLFQTWVWGNIPLQSLSALTQLLPWGQN